MEAANCITIFLSLVGGRSGSLFPGNLLVGRVGDVGFILLPGAREEEPWADAASTELPARDRGGDRPPLPQQQGPSRFLFFFFAENLAPRVTVMASFLGRKRKPPTFQARKEKQRGCGGGALM